MQEFKFRTVKSESHGLIKSQSCMGLGNHLIQALNVQMRKLRFPITWILYFYCAG